MNTNHSLLAAMSVALTLRCSPSTQQDVKPADAAVDVSTPGAAGSVQIFFASDLAATSGKCHRDDNFGCDLFSVNYNTLSKSFSDLKQLTNGSNAREFFPTISPDGKYLVHEVSVPDATAQPRIFSLNLSTGASTLLVAAGRFPDFSHDGTKLAYSDPDNGVSDRQVRYVPLTERDNQLWAGTPVLITSGLIGTGIKATDPQFFPDGSKLTLTLTDARDSNHVIDTQMSVVNLDGSDLMKSQPAEIPGCGHTAVSTDGTTVICGVSSGGATYKKVRSGDGWGPSTLIHKTLTKANFAPFDAIYASSACVRVLLSYQEFCASSSLIAATVQCTNSAAEVVHARVFLLKVTSETEFPEIIDLSSAAESLAGKSGRTMMTATCREKL